METGSRLGGFWATNAQEENFFISLPATSLPTNLSLRSFVPERQRVRVD